MALTKAQRARLDKLATYLEGLPRNYRHFDMNTWLDAKSNEAEVRYARKNGGIATCGTAACAAGHGPAAGVPVPRAMIDGPIVNWHVYARDYLCGGDYHSFYWLFNSDWGDVDNSVRGAAARIRYLLANGAPPEESLDGAGKSLLRLYRPYRIDAKAKADA